jgi:hypothetical protein
MEFNVEDSVPGVGIEVFIVMALDCGRKRAGVIERDGFSRKRSHGKEGSLS